MASYNLNRFNPQNTYFDNISTIYEYTFDYPWPVYNQNDITNSNSDYITDFNNWRFHCGFSSSCSEVPCLPIWYIENDNFETVPTAEYAEMICLQSNELNIYRERIEALMPGYLVVKAPNKSFISTNLRIEYTPCLGDKMDWKGELNVGDKRTRTVTQTDLPNPSPQTDCNCEG
jgi:hypothetical protein